ncbi:hypothetical protein AB205_0014280, partial [Aquarana catesbeiana]
QAATAFTVSVLRPLHSVHVKLPEENCCCSAPINTTGRQLQQAATVFTVSVLCPLHSVHLKLPEDNCWCSHTNNTTGRQLILLAAVSVYIYIPAFCSYISLQAISISGRPTSRGRQSQANKRGQAGSVSRGNSAGRGDGASSSAHGHGTRLFFFSAAGHVEPQHAEHLVEWMTKSSSSSGYFVWQSSCQHGLFPRLNGISHFFPSPTMSS